MMKTTAKNEIREGQKSDQEDEVDGTFPILKMKLLLMLMQVSRVAAAVSPPKERWLNHVPEKNT